MVDQLDRWQLFGCCNIEHAAVVWSDENYKGQHIIATALMLAWALVRCCWAYGFTRTKRAIRNASPFVRNNLANQTTDMALAGSDPAVLPNASQHPRNRHGQPHDVWGSRDVMTDITQEVASYLFNWRTRRRFDTFVGDALENLIKRGDIDAVVVNAHSAGTGIAFHVLKRMDPAIRAKVKAYVTSGTVLGKYVGLFGWRRKATGLAGIAWCNFYDPSDPVGDPLARRLTRFSFPPLSLFWHPDGGRDPLRVIDCKVDNQANGGSGAIPVHDYFDNYRQFVRGLSEVIWRVFDDQPLDPTALRVALGGLLDPDNVDLVT